MTTQNYLFDGNLLSGRVSKKLMVKARYKDEAMQVEISQ